MVVILQHVTHVEDSLKARCSNFLMGSGIGLARKTGQDLIPFD